jgi:hypothetical protein
MTLPMLKYPRTPHLTGSHRQGDDSALPVIAIERLDHEGLVVEEKVDGANCGIWFDRDGALRLQSRGHVLRGGPREWHFDRFKAWAALHEPWFHERLGRRFVLFGEWLHATHTLFYDGLPSFFLEFDMFDRKRDRFLATALRQELLDGGPVVPVAVVHTGAARASAEALLDENARSAYHTARWRENLDGALAELDRRSAQILCAQLDARPAREGLYFKIEDGDAVIERFKWVRPSFTQVVQEADTHWMVRPRLYNRLCGERSRPRDER